MNLFYSIPSMHTFWECNSYYPLDCKQVQCIRYVLDLSFDSELKFEEWSERRMKVFIAKKKIPFESCPVKNKRFFKQRKKWVSSDGSFDRRVSLFLSKIFYRLCLKVILFKLGLYIINFIEKKPIFYI